MELDTSEVDEAVGILLAAFNGEQYIADQLDSLIDQTYTNWKLFIRDDGSTDSTVDIITKYVAKDSRIVLVNNDFINLGSCQNFARLIEVTSKMFRYFMFCDQDDVWFPFKIRDTFSHLLYLEKQQKEEKPLLVYTNFQYVDRNLKIIESKKNYTATKIAGLDFNHLLAQNPVYGCTMMFNKPLVELIKEIPGEAENHDFWAALVASALGKISYLDKTTIFYRQHHNNISTNHDNSSIKKRFVRILVRREIFLDINAKIKMAVAFKLKFYPLLSNKNKTIIDDFIYFGKSKSFTFLFRNISNGVRRQTISQTLLFYLGLLLKKE
jgi:glycosyltransferase involved in cell wall biosynthesis